MGDFSLLIEDSPVHLLKKNISKLQTVALIIHFRTMKINYYAFNKSLEVATVRTKINNALISELSDFVVGNIHRHTKINDVVFVL